jgi:predicted GIY-YIG superfamily endonuclease
MASPTKDASLTFCGCPVAEIGTVIYSNQMVRQTKRPRRTLLKGLKPPNSQLPVPGPVGIFVYLLYVELGGEFSGYIGHTADIQNRMLTHRRSRMDRGSSAIFSMANAAASSVKLVVLEQVQDTGQKENVYIRREALWFYRFADAGWNLPNSEYWARFARPIDLDFGRLDTQSFLKRAVVLDDWLTEFGWVPQPKPPQPQ